MIRFKSRMTSQELADLLSCTPQTVNRWAREQNWLRRPLKGSQGGALEIFVNAAVREYLLNTRQLRYLADNYIYEPAAAYGEQSSDLALKLTEMVAFMTPDEQLRLSALLETEGASGLLARLGIADNEEK